LADVQARLARGRQVFWDAVGAGAGAGAPTHPTSPHTGDGSGGRGSR